MEWDVLILQVIIVTVVLVVVARGVRAMEIEQAEREGRPVPPVSRSVAVIRGLGGMAGDLLSWLGQLPAGRPALVVLAVLVAYLLLSKDVAEATMDETTQHQVKLACGAERIGQLFLAGATGDTTYGPLQFAEECRPTWFRAARYQFGHL